MQDLKYIYDLLKGYLKKLQKNLLEFINDQKVILVLSEKRQKIINVTNITNIVD